MTAPIRYNPCADGFPAKAWECLRRNEKFKEATGGEPEFDRCGSFEHFNWNVDLTEDMLTFHREAFVMINGFDPLLLNHDLRSCCLSNSWKVLSEDFRNRLDDTLMRHQPDRFSVPNLNAICPFLSSQTFSEAESRQFFWNLEEYLKTHELIVVPKFVWDTAHRKEIISDFKKILPKPTGNVKWLKPTGRTLGTEKEWDSFLCFEEWIRLGFVRGRACGLTAWELLGKVDFGNDPKERKQRADEFLVLKKTEHKYVSDICKAVEKIEACIASVYPDFRPFDI